MQTDGEQSFSLPCIAFVKRIHSPEERTGSTGAGPIHTTQDVKGRKKAKEGQVETGREQVCLRGFAFSDTYVYMTNNTTRIALALGNRISNGNRVGSGQPKRTVRDSN